MIEYLFYPFNPIRSFLMKTLKLSLLALSVISLAACSGGGGDSSHSAPQKNLTTPSQNINKQDNGGKNSNQANENQASKTSPNSAVANVISPRELSSSQSEASNTNNEPSKPNPNVELDNGKVIEKTAFEKGEITQKLDGYGTISGYNRKYSFNGAWVKRQEVSDLEVEGKNFILSKTVGTLGGLKGVVLTNALKSTINWVSSQVNDPEREIFYFGDETIVENIPKNGTMVYQGNATRYDNLTQEVKNIGTSKLTADFSNKKISGYLDIEGLRRNISLKEADIKGNGFAGKAVAGEGSILINREGRYEGKFFGPNAEEVAGKAMFDDKDKNLKDLNTSFSAEQAK